MAFNRHRRLLRSYAEVERKVAQRTQELEVANRQLLHSQKMNALGALAAGIAHDFNNILSIIKGSAQIIEDNLDDPGTVRLSAPIINDTTTVDGKPWGWTLSQRYTSLSRLQSGATTTSQLNAPGRSG